MSCTFWLRRKKKLAKQREDERQAVLATQTVEEETTVEETTVEEAKPTRKRVSKNADGETNSES